MEGMRQIMKDRSDSRPAARKGGLTITGLDDEILVYDPETMRASCLNSFAAEVLALCDGQRSAPEIARDLPFDNVDERVVWLALADLEKAQLLQDRSSFASNVHVPTNRRTFMKQLGLGSAVAMPIVAGIVLPTPAQAATCVPRSGICVDESECCNRAGCTKAEFPMSPDFHCE